jgi:hypothetical protein
MKKSLLIASLLIGCIAFNSFSQVNYQWVKTAGSVATEKSRGITVDKKGNSYITGQFGGNADFNLYGTTPYTLDKTGVFSGFIAKYDTLGNNVLRKNIRPIAISDFGTGTAIALDSIGNIYITGMFLGAVDFNPSLTADSILTSHNSSIDAFIAKYDTAGVFKWVRNLGSPQGEVATGLAVDNGGNVYVTGVFQGPGFSGDDGTTILPNVGSEDTYVVKYSTDGNYLWGNTIGGQGTDASSAIVVDKLGDKIFITGVFNQTINFNVYSNTDTLRSLGNSDVFLAKFSSDGTYNWSKQAGGLGYDGATAIAVDVANNIYLAGIYNGTADFGAQNIQPSAGGQNVFFSKCDNSGNFIFTNPLETAATSDSALVTSIAVDEVGDIYITGIYFGQIDLDPTGAQDILVSAGGQDIFFAKYLTDGTYKWSKKMGGIGSDGGSGIAVHNAENIYLAGYFSNTMDFNPSIGIANRVSTGAEDLFVQKYRQGTTTITGTVTFGSSNTLLASQNNKVELYTQAPNDANAVMQLVDQVEIDELNGTYVFSDLCAGTYYLLAVAGSDYPTVVSTYFGDTTHWEQAVPVVVGVNATYTKNINMIETNLLNGNATLSGYVLEGGGFDREPGDPIPNRDIVLQGDPSSIIVAHTQTDVNGYYQFNHVVGDSCYKIYVNVPGLPMDSTHHECPTITDSIINLDFVADSASIGVIPTTTGISQHLKTQKVQLSVYPNPNKGVIYAQLELQKESSVKLELYNIVGKKVLDLGKQTVKAGKTKIQINATDNNIGSGIYFLKIVVNNKELFTEKVIQID